VKAGWQVKKLHEICELINGRAYSKSELLSAGKYPVLRVGNFFTNDHWYHSDLELEEKKYCDKGDLLYAWSASFGPRIWAGEKVIFHYHIWKVDLDPILIDKMYFFYFFEWDVVKVKEDHGTGTTMMHVSKGSMEQRDILLPPLAEQKRIVSILDEALEGIATAKANAVQNLSKCDTIFESQLSSVFNQRSVIWPSKKIKDISRHSLGKMLDKAKNKGDFHPYLRNFNVRWFDFDLSDISEMPFLPEENEKYTAIKGDVLICEGGYPGRAAIWNLDYPIHFQKALHRVRFYDKSHSKWFLYYLYHLDKSGELKSHFNGAGIQHFTGESLAKFELPLPPFAEIEKAVGMFEELLEESRKLADVYRRKLVALDELKKSLLHKAFAGEL
jgi:type I restriction enzyme S subunit